jgi:6-pyruvoyltetrahydropterin/6-carboxytetrahydropterin synthase
MVSVTKIFHFEMAHAIHGYSGACKNIHGHSYELHVSVACNKIYEGYFPAPGFVIDFKELKKTVTSAIIENLDHKLILSRNFLSDNSSFSTQDNLVTWDDEPTAENLLVFISQNLFSKLPVEIKLVKLKLYETKDSYAEWRA